LAGSEAAEKREDDPGPNDERAMAGNGVREAS
jgi:hypothetical protein